MVRVAVERVFPNCPRYVHRISRLETSACVPCPCAAPPEPALEALRNFRQRIAAPPQGLTAMPRGRR
jgi:hypothetical protein